MHARVPSLARPSYVYTLADVAGGIIILDVSADNAERASIPPKGSCLYSLHRFVCFVAMVAVAAAVVAYGLQCRHQRRRESSFTYQVPVTLFHFDAEYPHPSQTG